MSERSKKPGDYLENGYKIIAISHRAVFAFDEKKQQYATWQFDCNGNTVNGHYFKINQIESQRTRDLAIGDYLLRK